MAETLIDRMVETRNAELAKVQREAGEFRRVLASIATTALPGEPNGEPLSPADALMFIRMARRVLAAHPQCS